MPRKPRPAHATASTRPATAPSSPSTARTTTSALWQSPESHEKYARLIAEWRRNARHLLPTTGRPADRLDAVGQRADPGVLPARPDVLRQGRPAHQRAGQHPPGPPVRPPILTAPPPPAEFGPLALKNVRQAMIDAGRSRTSINKDVHRIRRMFRWAVEEELYPGEACTSGCGPSPGSRRAAATPGRPAPVRPGRRGARSRPSCPTSRPRSPRWCSSSS